MEYNITHPGGSEVADLTSAGCDQHRLLSCGVEGRLGQRGDECSRGACFCLLPLPRCSAFPPLAVFLAPPHHPTGTTHNHTNLTIKAAYNAVWRLNQPVCFRQSESISILRIKDRRAHSMLRVKEGAAVCGGGSCSSLLAKLVATVLSPLSRWARER